MGCHRREMIMTTKMIYRYKHDHNPTQTRLNVNCKLTDGSQVSYYAHGLHTRD
jgi:hypothetical protein